MRNALAVCGKISSGKSSVIKELSHSHGWDIVSFGRYVRSIALAQHETPTRETYQQLGLKLFTERGAEQFLQDVIEVNQPTSNTHLFDGIRHVSIIEELKRRYTNTFVIYLDVSDVERYRRFSARASDDDRSVSYEQFLEISHHPIEQGIADIATVADAVIDASSSLRTLMSQVNIHLAMTDFL
jgi:dephospho-CoA kinase